MSRFFLLFRERYHYDVIYSYGSRRSIKSNSGKTIMTAQSENPLIAAFLDMTKKNTDDEIRKMFDGILTDQDLVKVPNESVDAEKFLNENRKSNPEAQKISDMLKKL